MSIATINYSLSAFPAISTFTFGGEECQSVNLRDLWRNLAIAKDFSSWARDQLDDFESGVDFEVFTRPGENSAGGRPAKEYAVTLDTAKHIALASRTARGREVRDYFIAAEKKLRKQELTPMTLAEVALANAQSIVNLERKTREQDAKIALLNERLEVQEAKSAPINAPLAVLPGGMEIKSHAIRRLARKHGLSEAVCDEIFDYYWNQLRTGITVVNPNERVRSVTPYCDAFYVKMVNDVFNRVLRQMKPTPSGKMFTHKAVYGAFHAKSPQT
ncbi:antA/AntB antirepressor family protein [Burkholderia multivorans]|uniref:antA/AntB antirepressor family protein n=1 Tax=Burkholderia multivorans TaxID=87883 RepID=UPI0021C0DB1A|nr:antA/AntB antirepressor family protein [Burkholderia multivorans]